MIPVKPATDTLWTKASKPTINYNSPAIFETILFEQLIRDITCVKIRQHHPPSPNPITIFKSQSHHCSLQHHYFSLSTAMTSFIIVDIFIIRGKISTKNHRFDSHQPQNIQGKTMVSLYQTMQSVEMQLFRSRNIWKPSVLKPSVFNNHISQTAKNTNSISNIKPGLDPHADAAQNSFCE